MSAAKPARAACGMTLIEVLIVVVIVGILASIAYPSYQRQVRETRRVDGKAALLDTAQRLERCFTEVNGYAACTIATNLGPGFLSPEKWYLITASDLTPSTFTLVATPQRDQTQDTRCGALTLTHIGQRGVSSTTPDRCW